MLCASSTSVTGIALTCGKLMKGSPTSRRTERKTPFHILLDIINLVKLTLILKPCYIWITPNLETKDPVVMFWPSIATILKPFFTRFVNRIILKLHLCFCHTDIIAWKWALCSFTVPLLHLSHAIHQPQQVSSYCVVLWWWFAVQLHLAYNLLDLHT